MEKRHRCKLCFRNFANGRALGGHMRSHMMKFYDEARKKQQQEEDDDFQSITSISPSSFSSSSSSEEEDQEESEQVKALLVDHDFYVAAALQDRESETESSEKKKKMKSSSRVRCRRSKRISKPRVSDLNGYFHQVKKKSKFEKINEDKWRNSYEQYSSLSSDISDTTPEEHVAHCLIMLSRDKWRRAEVEFHEKEEEEEEDYISGVATKVIKTKVRGKYRCEECNKLFKSYQALGGHRASHKKIKADAAAARPNAYSGGGSKAAAAEEKLHECPFCHRIFSSGQALGGHKRSHFIGSGTISVNVSNTGPVKQKPRNGDIFNIDLNLPAPIDDEENSQIAVSAVSDAEFVHPIKQ